MYINRGGGREFAHISAKQFPYVIDLITPGHLFSGHFCYELTDRPHSIPYFASTTNPRGRRLSTRLQSEPRPSGSVRSERASFSPSLVARNFDDLAVLHRPVSSQVFNASQNRDPAPGVLSTAIVDPWTCAIACAMARPSPKPDPL